MPAPSAINALELLEQLSVEDIERQIAELNAQLEAFTKDIGGKIAGLQVLRKAADLQQNGAPERKPRGPNKAKPTPKPTAVAPVDRNRATHGDNRSEHVLRTPGAPTIADRLKTYLERAGKAKPVVMAEDMELNRDSVFSTISQHKELFEPMGGGYWKLRGSKVA